jgi:hypothetical protein
MFIFVASFLPFLVKEALQKELAADSKPDPAVVDSDNTSV